jgi:AraC-like DNA-binding protein
MPLETVSRIANYSPYHFHRLFNATYGVTPHAFVTECRLNRAKRLLREGGLSVTEVCYTVGFRSPGSFSSLFAREVGESPGRYAQRFVRIGWDPWRLIPWCARAVQVTAHQGRTS